jgi:(2S)-methylsuccinyl-CoA dehydrogenase
MSATSNLDAGAVIDHARGLIAVAGHHLGRGTVDDNQQIAYDLAHAAAAIETAAAADAYGCHGRVERQLADAFAADAVHDLATRLVGREPEWGLTPDALDPMMPFVRAHRSPRFLSSLADQDGLRHLDSDHEMVADTFRRFAEDKIRPIAEHVHRHNDDIPEDLITALAELGTFGLSIPERYGGYATGGEGDLLAMVVATEELSYGSLGVAGSLITRPEILGRALLEGATEDQKRTWLPRLASGEVMSAFAGTEPDHGSDSGAITTRATRTADGDYAIDGVKTWCTFAGRADVLLVMARTDPDRSRAHRGVSMFLVPKPRATAHHFRFVQPDGGSIEGRAIDTIGYRGMHSFEVSFDRWRVPADHLVGGESGLGRGFYMQMAGFDSGRLQTAARAVGVMQAAYEAARSHAAGRVVFERPLDGFEVTRIKLARMAVVIQATRQFTYQVAKLIARGTGEGVIEAAMVKAYACRSAEWVTREAMQLHGGMGYAEECAVSRYFVDARVLSIFEGADELLALKVIARRLIGERPMVPPRTNRQDHTNDVEVSTP